MAESILVNDQLSEQDVRGVGGHLQRAHPSRRHVMRSITVARGRPTILDPMALAN
jgi:hypothetical protein